MIIALSLACGRGERMKTTRPKQYMCVAGKPLLRWSLEALASAPHIHKILPVIHREDLSLYQDLVSPPQEEHTSRSTLATKLLPPAFGGSTRYESTVQGLLAIKPLRPTYVLVHDGARPFVSEDLLARLLGNLGPHGIVPAVAIHDTVRRLEGPTAVEDLDRSNLYRIQTPQVFPYAPLLKAFEQFMGTLRLTGSEVAQQATIFGPQSSLGGQEGRTGPEDPQGLSGLPRTPPFFLPTDDASLFAWAGHKVKYLEGCPLNIKATTPQDLETLAWLLKRKDLP